MIKTKKQMYALIGSFILVILLGTVTYAFFNYTRTGTANTIKTGRIAFNSSQGTAINLTNMFPIDPTENGIMDDSTKVGTVTINVTGDTTYTGGLEYLVTAVNVTNTVGSGQNSKSLPISIDVSVANNSNNDPATTLGTEEEEYFEKRGSVTSYYRVLAKDVIENNEQLLVGYIAPGSDGVDGNIVIKAYLDKNKIAISDTYPEGDVTHTENEGTEQEEEVVDYTNGTTSTWVNGRTVFTTTEWNTLQANGVSFQVKVEANEGIWVEEIRTVNAMNTFPATITDQKANIKEVYFNKMGATRMQNAYDAATIKADITSNNEGKVLVWLETNTTDNTKYNLIIASDGDTYFPTDCSRLFDSYLNVEKIEFNNVNSSRVTLISYMFNGCEKLANLDLSMLDKDNITSGAQVFGGCTNLSTINLDNWNLKQSLIGFLSSMTSSDITISLRNWKLPANWEWYYGFFNQMSGGNAQIKTIDVSYWDLSNTENISGLFSNGRYLENISGLDTWDTTNITNMSRLFENCSSLDRIYVGSRWNTSNVTNSSDMFKGMTLLVGEAPNTTYAFDSNDAIDKTYAVIATDDTKGYLTDISLKP